MSPWYVPSLVPILVLSACLAGLVLWRDRRHWPIAAYCLSLAVWSAAILLAARPQTVIWGDRAMMTGFFVPATFLLVAARDLGWGRSVVGGTLALGALMAASGFAVPDLYLSGGGTRPGTLFAPMFAATVAVGVTPLLLLWRAPYDPAQRERRRYLVAAGAAMAVGGALQVASMLSGTFYPLGLYLLACSTSLVTFVAQADQLPTFDRFVERTQRYTLLAAMLSTGWMMALVWTVQGAAGWTWEAALLLFVLTLTAQPLLTEVRVRLTDRVFPGRGDAEGLTRALARSEARAEHARRLAEIGTMASAVAHEVRNPLGVITACASVLERQGADPEVLGEIRDQVARGARFADELLEYGRPPSLELRPLSIADAARAAASEVGRALGMDRAVSVEGDASVEADLGQVVRLFGVLVENALLADATTVRIRVTPSEGARIEVEDDGGGVPAALADRLFAPFVSGRGRSGPRPGTGLGLAIGAGIAERHGGTLGYEGKGHLGGARFVVALPPRPPSAEPS